MSLGLGLIIGVTEELLWRGVYVTLFPGNAWLSIHDALGLGGLAYVAWLSQGQG